MDATVGSECPSWSSSRSSTPPWPASGPSRRAPLRPGGRGARRHARCPEPAAGGAPRGQAGQAQLTLVIGLAEATGIAVPLQGVVPPRPLTHDLFLTLFGRLKVKLTRVVVTDLKDGIYYATVHPDGGRRRPHARLASLGRDRPGHPRQGTGAGRGPGVRQERAASPPARPWHRSGGVSKLRRQRSPVGAPAPDRGRLREARREVRRPHGPGGDQIRPEDSFDDVGGLQEAKRRSAASPTR